MKRNWLGLSLCLLGLYSTVALASGFANLSAWVGYSTAEGTLWPASIEEIHDSHVTLDPLFEEGRIQVSREQIFALDKEDASAFSRMAQRARFVRDAINSAGGQAEILSWEKRFVAIKRLPTQKTLAKDLNPRWVFNDAPTIDRLIAELETIGGTLIYQDPKTSGLKTAYGFVAPESEIRPRFSSRRRFVLALGRDATHLGLEHEWAHVRDYFLNPSPNLLGTIRPSKRRSPEELCSSLSASIYAAS